MMKYIIASLILMFSLNAFSQTKISPKDIKMLIGNWEGSLTYIDYKTSKPYTMPANLVVKQGNKENILLISNIYPNEPKANGSDKITISANGKQLNNKSLSAINKLENGALQIQTKHLAKDDNKKAIIRYTYTINRDLFIILKEVQFEKLKDWIKRSQFSYVKKK